MTKEEIIQKAIGTWKMTRIYGYCENDGTEINHYGHHTTGILMYQPSGYMSVQLVNNPRERFQSEDWNMGTDAEIRAAFLSYQAYYGKFYYDEEAEAIIHKMEGSLFPNWHLGNLGELRYAEFEEVGEDELLHIRTPPIEIKGKEYVFHAIWKRAL